MKGERVEAAARPVSTAVARLVCRFFGHRRYPDAPYYWHSHERCARCHVLTVSPMAAPHRWKT